jgi:hypothetical protein
VPGAEEAEYLAAEVATEQPIYLVHAPNEGLGKFAKDFSLQKAYQQPLLSSLESQYDAFIDWPISYLYPYLDRRFPESKFILTVRDPTTRYRSARRHIKEDQARRDEGRSYAWTGIAPKKAFIREDARYTAAVMSYFEGRSKDLLVLRIGSGEGWGELCNFLGVRVPTEPFPHHRALGSHDSQFLRKSPIEPRPVHLTLNLMPPQHASVRLFDRFFAAFQKLSILWS